MIRDRFRSPILRIGALLVTGSILVTACGSSATPSPSPTVAPSPSPTVAPSALPAPTVAPSPATATAGTGAYAACASAATTPITLTEWDQEVREGIGNSVDQLSTEFMAANPGVTIKRVSKSFDDLKATVKQALADATNGPDIAEVNQGRPDMGAAVQAGLLLPLTKYETQYGWDKRWGSSVLARNSFSDDGKTFGTGSLYGVSITGEIVGLFYNKNLFTQYGLSVPTSMADLTAQLATIKSKGGIPIAFGNLGGDAIQIYHSILETLVTPDWLNNFVYGTGGVSFNTPETKAAADALVAMGDAGDFTTGYAGISYDDSGTAFAAGKGVYMWTGSWEGATLTGKAGEIFGFIRVPPLTVGGSAMSVGGVGLPWSIRKTSKNADCAAAYLDYITSDHAMTLVAGNGILTSHAATGATGSSALYNDMAAAFNDANSKNQVGHYTDWSFPTAWDVVTQNLAKLLAHQETSDQFVTAVDKPYQAFLQTLK
jgi:raffinose/stachyose/melibiose transport system substrate-binding protein